MAAPRRVTRVTSRNARFQQWEALLGNRTKRHRLGEFLIQGVRPITLALDHQWPLSALLVRSDTRRSRWAEEAVRRTDAPLVELSGDLMGALGGKDEDVPELIAVGQTRPDELSRVDVRGDGLLVVFDRPTSPGNLGTLIRSADAFGAVGVVVTGHAADVYDPRTVRASTGSLFAVPTVRVDSPEVLDWLAGLQRHGTPVRVVGTDEAGTVDLSEADLTGPTALVLGNETTGMSAALRDACDTLVAIPIGGAASSLNAAAAGSIVLYEAARQRGFPARRG